MAIGSPALAAYSLAITRLNGRWLARQFSYLHFPNKDHIPLVVSNLQHIPFTIDASGPLLPSLIVLPQNDRYWRVLGVAAKRTRQWTIPVAMNIIWAIVAIILTIVDSFMDLDHSIIVPGDAGYSIAAAWTYLIPLVAGWLYVGSQPEADYLRNALDEAQGNAYVATAAKPVLATWVTEVTGRPTRAIDPSTKYIDYVNADEKRTTPIFNYSRVFIWSQNAELILKFYEHAAANADRRRPVQDGAEWMSFDDSSILAPDRVGTEAEVEQYCMEEPKSPNPGLSAMRPVFATEVFQRVAFATALALGLQWGTTGVAILIHLKTPPMGFGCRAMTFTIYGAAATVAFGLLLLSSLLAHLARRQSISEERSGLKTFAGCIAMSTRCLGKLIAIMNGVGILVSCVMQFTGAYDNCFCSSTIFGGDPNGLVSFTDEAVKGSGVHGYWVGGIFAAAVVSSIYTFVIFVATPMG
jgi:hypothetical protein